MCKQIDFARYKGRDYIEAIKEMEVNDPCPLCSFHSIGDGLRYQYAVTKVDYVGFAWKCQVKGHGAWDMTKFMRENWKAIAEAKEKEPSENEFGPVSP